MYRQCRSLIPVIRMYGNRNLPEVSRRNFFDFSRSPDFRSVMRNFERQMDHLERDFYRPFRRLVPRFIPIEGSEVSGSTYRLNIDVQGFKPEEIKVSVKDKVLSIHAKMERKSEDGNKYQQEVLREFTIPDSIDASALKSFLGTDGVLTLEAPYKEGEVKQIPVSHESSKKP